MNEKDEALKNFVQTVTITGGVYMKNKRMVGCVADPTWLDLADAYILACKALNITPLIQEYTE